MNGRKKVVITCISDHPKSHLLLQAGRKAAQEYHADWQVLFVETPDFFQKPPSTREMISKLSTLAENDGADLIILQGNAPYPVIMQHVTSLERKGVEISLIILGSTNQRTGWLSYFRTSLAEKLNSTLRHHCRVQTIPLGQPSSTMRIRLQSFSNTLRALDIVYALLAVFAAYVISEGLKLTLTRAEFLRSEYNVALIFLLACAFAATRLGLVPGLVAALGSFVTINYLYIRPYYAFDLGERVDIINLLLFLVCSVILSLFTGVIRSHNRAVIDRERRTQILYEINRLANSAIKPDEALRILHDGIHNALGMPVAFFLPPDSTISEIELAYPDTYEFDDTDQEALLLSWSELCTAGAGSFNSFTSSWRFEPMITANGPIGVLAIQIPKIRRLDASFGRFVTALADQSASLLERIHLSESHEKSRLREEKEKLRAMLLSAVSHDLKTPLASIIGSLSVYHSMFDHLSEEHRRTLTQTALEEAQHLDGFISNILDMTRLESGEIDIRQEWLDPYMLLLRVRKRIRTRLVHHELHLPEQEKAYEVYLDGTMTEQVIQNVLENAIKYTPENTGIDVSFLCDDAFHIRIRDHGKGIVNDMLEKIFDKYTRIRQEDKKIAGTGLGLAISRAMMKTQGGNITATNHPEGGAVFTVTLPQYRVVSATVEGPELRN